LLTFFADGAQWWFEDICDPLDFETLAVATRYAGPIAAGEALFSAAEAKLLDRHACLRRDRDILLFDPVHCLSTPITEFTSLIGCSKSMMALSSNSGLRGSPGH
jgi:hypothetical protein